MHIKITSSSVISAGWYSFWSYLFTVLIYSMFDSKVTTFHSPSYPKIWPSHESLHILIILRSALCSFKWARRTGSFTNYLIQLVPAIFNKLHLNCLYMFFHHTYPLHIFQNHIMPMARWTYGTFFYWQNKFWKI